MSEQSDTPRQTPLVELLLAVPEDARLIYEHSPTESQSIPVGPMCRQAAMELATATRERDEARAIANDRDAMVDHRDRALTAMYQRVDVITQERDKAIADLETERLRLAACGVVAMANTPESAARVRDILPVHFSASLHSVMGAVDREMELRAEVERLRSAFVHCHVRGSAGDLCAVCGLDLRDKVHTAATEAKP